MGPEEKGGGKSSTPTKASIGAVSPFDEIDQLNGEACLEVVDTDEGRAVLHLLSEFGVKGLGFGV